jgi:transposase-like protein
MKADTKARNLEIWRRMRNGETQMQICNALKAAGYDVTYVAVRNVWQRMRLAGRPLFYTIDPKVRDEIRRMTSEGMPIDHVARALRVNHLTVKRWMAPEEIERRDAEARARRAVADQVVAMAKATGKGPRGIARELGISPNVACGAIDRARQRGELPPPRAMASYRKRVRLVPPAIPSKKRAPRIKAVSDAPVTLSRLASIAEVDSLLDDLAAADSAEPCRIRHSPSRSGRDVMATLELDVTET